MIGRKLDRYLLRNLVSFFILMVVGTILLYVIFDIFERIDVFVDNRTPARLIASYYVSRVPYIFIFMSPVAILLATFMAFGQMTKFNEITAMKTAGISLYRIFLPAYLFALLVSGAVFTVSETLLPGAEQNRKNIYDEQIRGRVPRRFGIKMNLSYLGSGGRVYTVRRFDIRHEQLQEVMVQEFEENRLTRRVDARIADWTGGAWTFRNGVVRTFYGDDEVLVPFDSLAFPEFRETPEDLAQGDVDENQMSFRDLGTYVRKLRESGRPTSIYATERSLKLAYPLGVFLATLFAAPLAVRLRRGGIAIGFGLSFAIFMTYICFVQFGRVLGHAGQIPPDPAAWMGNIVFLAAAVVLLVRAPK